MQAASRDHVLDTGPKGKTGHDGTDRSTPKQRCERYVKVEGNSGENIDYGTKGPMDVIVALCIDDGVPSRGHRHNIFNKGFKKMACFTGSHKTYGSQTVINYNGSAAEMNAFMKQKVDFGPVPDGATSWSTKTSCSQGGGKITKTSTITYEFKDGSKKTKTVVEEMSL